MISGGVYPLDEHSSKNSSTAKHAAAGGGTSAGAHNVDSNIALFNSFTSSLLSTTSSLGSNVSSLGSNVSKLISTAVTSAAAASASASGVNAMVLQQHQTSVEVLQQLTEGGYSIVYLARPTAVPAIRYALKVVTCHDPESAANALNELNMLKAVINNHPHNHNLIQLLDYSVIHSSQVTVYNFLFPLFSCSCWDKIEEYMNYTGGASRESDPMGAGAWDNIPWPFPEKLALQVIAGVANALAYIHQMGYCHRDIKPHNVLLEYTGDNLVTPVLMDLGSMCVAKTVITGKKHALSMQEQASLHTSPAYRPPELVTVPYTPYMMSLITGSYDDTLVITEAVDVWSLGCVAYALAFGISPFESIKTGECSGRVRVSVCLM